ncbi:MAG: ATP-dependent Clp protease proteolytic subunit [Pseudonocardiales bacterium]|nr:MAG: ATP-dependent Clp protease proteolytic subunit [Pseudonocardiales bacterium]
MWWPARRRFPPAPAPWPDGKPAARPRQHDRGVDVSEVPYNPSARYEIPTWWERTSLGERQYTPFSRLFDERIIFLGTPIVDEIANVVMAQILCLESMDPDRDISIYINSPGGSFTALTAIYDTMQFVRPDIQTTCMGQAASAAAVLLAAGTPGKRLALPNARILIHQPSIEQSGGQGSDIEIQAREILRMRTQMEEMIARHSNVSPEQVRRDTERDKILTAEEAKDYGLIDAVIESRKLSSLATA